MMVVAPILLKFQSHLQTLFAAVACAFLGLSISVVAIAASSSPPAPASSPHYNRTDGVISFWQWKVSRDPDDFFSYDRLGAAYIQKARETGDITYYGLAEDSLKKSLALESKDREAVTALAHLATVYFGEHRFADAIDYANRAEALKTGDVSQYAIIGDARLEMGQYDKAAAAFNLLREAAKSTDHSGPRTEYLAETRFAALDFIEGKASRSEAELRQAVAMAREVNAPAENVAWTQFMLGEELFMTGDCEAAEQCYRDSLESYPGYHRALAGLAKIEAAKHHYDKAAQFYHDAIARIPLPIYAAALGDVYIKMGRHDEARKQFELVEYIAQLSVLNKTVYNRELAMFYADHDIKLPESVTLASKELEIRKDIYSWDVFAFALYKNGDYKGAADADVHAVALGTPDPLLLFHAGVIQRALGNDRRATDYLRRALALNPEFHVLYADVARSDLRDLEIKAADDKMKSATLTQVRERNSDDAR